MERDAGVRYYAGDQRARLRGSDECHRGPEKFASVARVPGHAFGLWCLPKDLSALHAALCTADTPRGTIGGALQSNVAIEALLGVGRSPGTSLFEYHDGRFHLTDQGTAQVQAAFAALRQP